jgi:hypothetical protein
MIVCSSRSDTGIQAEARLLGADRYFGKPVRREDLNDAFVELTAAQLVDEVVIVDALPAPTASGSPE